MPNSSKNPKLKLYSIGRSDIKNKKWKAVFKKGDKYITSHFGDSRYKDYTQHGNYERRKSFIQRANGIIKKYNKKDDPTAPVNLSLYLLWGPSMSFMENLEKYRKKFNV